MGTVGVKELTLQHKTSAYTQKDPTNYAVFGICYVFYCVIFTRCTETAHTFCTHLKSTKITWKERAASRVAR